VSEVTKAFRLAILHRRAEGVRMYQIARAVNVRPNELSGIFAGSIEVRRNDPRVLRVAAFLGLSPGECFEDDAKQVAS
jgi:hypothetical protein